MYRRLVALVIWLSVVACMWASLDMEPYRQYMKSPEAGKMMATIQFYEEAAKIDSTQTEARMVLAYLYNAEMNKNLDQMIRTPLDNGVAFSTANLLLSIGRYDDAIKLYNTLNENTPNWSCPWRHKGEALWKTGKLQEAAMALQKAIETREEHVDAYVMLANVQMELNQNKKALQTLEKGLTHVGKDIESSEEEMGAFDMDFLHLKLLKLNKKNKEFNALKQDLLQKVPNDPRWEEIQAL